jgi:hypothetical protein
VEGPWFNPKRKHVSGHGIALGWATAALRALAEKRLLHIYVNSTKCTSYVDKRLILRDNTNADSINKIYVIWGSCGREDVHVIVRCKAL